jgi:hypothetical protein
MATLFGYKRLATVDDWRGLAGDDKWVPTRSAYELAHCWHQFGGLPAPIADALNASGQETLRELSVDLCLVEKPVFLDTKIAPSMTDLMAYGRNGKGDSIVVAVEGKADEPFASPVWAWVRGDEKNATMAAAPRRTRLRRLEFLSKHLAVAVPPDSGLRYQLLHRTVSAVLEAQLHGAVAALVLVHAFGPDAPANLADFAAFLRELGGSDVTKGTVLGPYQLGERRDLPTYFLWWQQAATGQAAQPSVAADAPQAARR